ncbi:hypothetical protein [Salinisphaera sp.]|nr:hypothetical protein [Salinisphaera sp.]HET7313350.1 hypothetical protein [Salinisphaera sp.]
MQAPLLGVDLTLAFDEQSGQLVIGRGPGIDVLVGGGIASTSRIEASR